jgi:hypothetical protein
MFFGSKKEIKCENCSSKFSEKFNFCPYCGRSAVTKEKELQEFGMLGRDDIVNESASSFPLERFGITDKLIGTIMNSLMKNFDKQFSNIDKESMFEGTEIQNLPNGIRIRVGMPHQVSPQKQKQKQAPRKQITQVQLEKMSKLPRAEAKTKIRRLSDKIVYELSAPGIQSPEDIFISKLESGYEIKAIGKKKVYVNSIPISLPLKGYALDNNKLLVEFLTDKQ